MTKLTLDEVLVHIRIDGGLVYAKNGELIVRRRGGVDDYLKRAIRENKANLIQLTDIEILRKRLIAGGEIVDRMQAEGRGDTPEFAQYLELYERLLGYIELAQEAKDICEGRGKEAAA